MNQLIEDIKAKLNIKGGVFIDMEIEEYIQDIDASRHIEFFKALSGGDFEFKSAMDRIAIVAKRFKTEKTELLLEGTRDQAKAMYDKFYAESCSMLDFTQKNRDKYPSDKEFFLSVKYDTLKRTDGTNSYTKQEMYVLNELGGGEWLRCIRLALNSNDLINKIEAIIKKAVITKYGNQTNAIESKKVAGLLRGVK